MNIYSSKEWKKLRQKVLVRDRFKCVVCGVSVAGFKRSRCDHIIPVKQRPDLAFVMANIQTLCAVCDNRKHFEKLGNKAKQVTPTGEDGWPL